MTYTAELNPNQARSIASHIVKNHDGEYDGEYDGGLCATSNLIVFRYRDGIGEVYSDYLADEVIELVPKGYRKMFLQD